mgnify:CR=1 FL=1
MDSSYLKTYAESADANTMAHGLPLTDLQKSLIRQVDEAGPTWAERAFEHDRLAIFPTENWNDLKRMGFLGLCVPKRHGGIGADQPGAGLQRQRGHRLARYRGAYAFG